MTPVLIGKGLLLEGSNPNNRGQTHRCIPCVYHVYTMYRLILSFVEVGTFGQDAFFSMFFFGVGTWRIIPVSK